MLGLFRCILAPVALLAIATPQVLIGIVIVAAEGRGHGGIVGGGIEILVVHHGRQPRLVGPCRPCRLPHRCQLGGRVGLQLRLARGLLGGLGGFGPALGLAGALGLLGLLPLLLRLALRPPLPRQLAAIVLLAHTLDVTGERDLFCSVRLLEAEVEGGLMALCPLRELQVTIQVPRRHVLRERGAFAVVPPGLPLHVVPEERLCGVGGVEALQGQVLNHWVLAGTLPRRHSCGLALSLAKNSSKLGICQALTSCICCLNESFLDVSLLLVVRLWPLRDLLIFAVRPALQRLFSHDLAKVLGFPALLGPAGCILRIAVEAIPPAIIATGAAFVINIKQAVAAVVDGRVALLDLRKLLQEVRVQLLLFRFLIR
mmetsp:Transcript_10179/g.30613  ORF Transcript_10179/g.30613 Transcript_10179/m.30613 type:complete len:371 (+) Transcript_10179:1256-2368(+)